MAGGVRVKELNESMDLLNDNDYSNDSSDDSIDVKDVNIQMKDKQADNNGLDLENQESDNLLQKKIEENNKFYEKRGIFQNGGLLQEGCIIDMASIIEINCTANRKQEEEKMREQKRKELDE